MELSDGMRMQIKQGADSVFSYVERTAETVAEGVRWQTYTHSDETQYGANVYNGVAGITFFLSDYARLTGNHRARDLASGALSWCISQPRLRDDFENASDNSLGMGWAGIGLAWLRYGVATGDRIGVEEASRIGDRILEDTPSPYTSLMQGNAGTGLFLLHLGSHTGAARFVDGAIQVGRWLKKNAVREASRCYWPREIGDTSTAPRLGLGPGLAGIGYFLLALYEATKDPCWADLAGEAIGTLDGQAIDDRGGKNWSWDLDGKDPSRLRCQWCVGAPGAGLLYAKAYELLNESSYLETARAAGEATFAHGDERNNPCQCHGLAGSADLFFELHRITEDHLWLDRGLDFIRRIFEYRAVDPTGDVWPADTPGFSSPELMNGAAGVGHFFLRLTSPDPLRMPIL